MDDDMSQDPCRIILVDGLPFTITMAAMTLCGNMLYPCFGGSRLGKVAKMVLQDKAVGYILVLDLWKQRILQAASRSLIDLQPSYIYFGLGITSGYSV
jgi:hypothetical protein